MSQGLEGSSGTLRTARGVMGGTLGPVGRAGSNGPSGPQARKSPLLELTSIPTKSHYEAFLCQHDPFSPSTWVGRIFAPPSSWTTVPAWP